MKNILMTILLSTLFLSSTAFAKKEKTIAGSYKGTKKVQLRYYAFRALECNWDNLLCLNLENEWKNKTFNIRFNADITKSSTGRITLFITSQDKKKCAGLGMKFIGEEDGFGGYDLYRNKEEYLQNLNIGTLTFNGKNVQIVIPQDMTKQSNGNHGTECTWDLQYGLDLKLK
ncbi:hypothetical protein ABMA70_15215 [Halobacteriovorax sp. XZX-3]|uniref:hypothetical protein n=1 Tax=unclassified Halobacteriovorax TaxID=2639665 RepID=UPI0037150CCE